MNTKTFIPQTRQEMEEGDIQEVICSLRENCITRGKRARKFEEEIALFCGAKYAVSFNSGTSALSAAYFAIDLAASDQVITSPNTFIGTITEAIRKRARLSFVDIEEKSGNLSIEKIRKNPPSLSSRGKNCFVPVHFAGVAVDVKKLDRLLTPNCLIIEDAAQALGSLYPDGSRVGGCLYSDLTIFSFHPAKIITTGEGGAVTTNDALLYQRLLLYRNNGMKRKIERGRREYHIMEASGNFHLTEFQAALGKSQLARLPSLVQKRREIVARYRKQLSSLQTICLPQEEWDERTAYQLLSFSIDFSQYSLDRNELIEKLYERGIGTDVHYLPLYHHPLLQKNYPHLSEEEYPETEKFFSRQLSLPLYSHLSEEQVDTVCFHLKELLQSK